jgi:hypothetical protein
MSGEHKLWNLSLDHYERSCCKPDDKPAIELSSGPESLQIHKTNGRAFQRKWCVVFTAAYFFSPTSETQKDKPSMLCLNGCVQIPNSHFVLHL